MVASRRGRPATADGAAFAARPSCEVCGREAGYRLPGASAPARVRCARHLALSRPVARRAAVTALAVGTVLTAINQGDALLAMSLPAALLWKVPLTYCVPYCVATWGALAGARL